MLGKKMLGFFSPECITLSLPGCDMLTMFRMTKKYARKYFDKIRKGPIGYSGAREKLIHEKRLEPENLVSNSL